MATTANFKNRTLWIGDNLDILRGINSETIDLIYLDPPFNSKRIYNAPLGSKAAGAKFVDTWKMSSVTREWKEMQESADKAIWHTVEGAGLSADESMQAYLCFMAPRLVEIHRILKPTGSMYLHCDPTASHYLKQLLDCVFGNRNFRNEIVWLRIKSGKQSQHQSIKFGSNSDSILFYARSPAAVCNPTRTLTTEERDKKFPLIDPKRGPYYDDSSHIFRPAGLGPRPNLCYEWRGFQNPGPSGWTMGKDRLEQEFQLGNFVILSNAKLQRRKYLHDHQGLKMPNVWSDIAIAGGKERTGWPTQKPLALLERIIMASSRTGDMILDPFAGCATTCIAAEKLGRRWAGIDIDSRAEEVTRDRLVQVVDQRNNLTTKGKGKTEQMPGFAFDQTTQKWEVPEVYVLDTAPKRTDPDQPKRTPNKILRAILWAALPKLEDGRGVCVGCERGKYEDDFALDHITPKSKGGPDIDANLQLLCGSCNSIKGQGSMADLLAKRAQLQAF